ncbi:hypothetical protein [Paraburkholderia flagellata]|uniref:hypothetical protein n=1 Tax=Paraburkholderia flagellata TaxID=2883241 RepID=UPI001F20A6DC|nr:hypothetical protein [Paraburkholderia flagellata]
MSIKAIAILTVVSGLAGCAHEVPISSQSGAAEVMSTKVSQQKAYLVFSSNLMTASKEVKPGFACGAHSFPMAIGDALKSSITRTVGAAYPHSLSTGSAIPSTADGLIFKFDLSDFDPTIRFAPGFLVPTADANVEIAVQARVADKTGKELITTTFHGHGHASEDGACGIGADALGDAAKKAIQDAMENFVDKVINTGALDTVATTVSK